MTCAEFRRQFPEYASGRLPEMTAAALEAHLEHCAACEATLASESPPLMEARSLPRSIDPAFDLWPEISGRMAARRGILRGRVVLPRWSLAAAAMILIALSSGLTAVLLRRAGPGTVQASSNVEAEYAAASQELAEALEAARSRISPEAIATIEKSLLIIDAALSESRQALARDPGNEALSQLVVAAWRQKLDLLRRATAMEKAS